MKMKDDIMQKFLVADQDSKTLKFIRGVLTEQENVRVLSTTTGDAAIELAWRKKPDMIIINTELMDLSGWEVLGILKKNDPTRDIPFIMIDQAGSIEDEVRALNLGADDYLIKPLRRELFLARVKAVLHRYLIIHTQKKKPEEEIIKSGNIVINLTTHTAHIKGKPIELTPKEFALLYLFIKKQGHVLNRVFLSGTIWAREYFDTSYTIDRHIANLRKKLGREGKRIQPLHNIGYKFERPGLFSR